MPIFTKTIVAMPIRQNKASQTVLIEPGACSIPYSSVGGSQYLIARGASRIRTVLTHVCKCGASETDLEGAFIQRCFECHAYGADASMHAIFCAPGSAPQIIFNFQPGSDALEHFATLRIVDVSLL